MISYGPAAALALCIIEPSSERQRLRRFSADAAVRRCMAFVDPGCYT